MTIHAFAAKTLKARLEPFSYPEPALGPYDVLIDITHCGLCHSDLHLIDNDWKKSVYPLIPGHEVIGTISKKGSAVQLSVGTRVGVSWQHSACLECSSCLTADTHFCPKRIATCNGHFGGFASQMTADSRFIYPIPEGLDSAHAAPLLCAGATVYGPFRRLKIQAPDRVAIIGIGGLGHLAIQFANAFGCEVTAISTSPDKEKEAISFGAKRFTTLDRIAANPSELSLYFDYILSTVHADLNGDLICSLLKHTGTLCLLGRPSTPMNISLLSSLSSQRSITGGSVGNRMTIIEMLNFAAEHNISPKIEVMKMSEINEAIAKVRANKARYRIVLTP